MEWAGTFHDDYLLGRCRYGITGFIGYHFFGLFWFDIDDILRTYALCAVGEELT